MIVINKTPASSSDTLLTPLYHFLCLLGLYFSFVAAIPATEQDNKLIYWKKLLHFGESGSRVVSTKFFLTANGNKDYQGELDETIQRLKLKEGLQIACRFPARYQWISTSYDDIPQYQLKDCPDLHRYISGFQKQTVSVSFATEYLDHPVSSFGHTMLVFHDVDKPLLSADTVHFAARTDKTDGSLTYTWKGLTGAYPGYFFRDAFFKKQFQYNILEQRYIHLYTLDFTEQQIERLIYHLYELRNARYDYYFIKENCAYQIATLLDIATHHTHFSDAAFVLPIEVIKAYKGMYKDKRVLYPTSVTINNLLEEMTEQESLQFESIISGEMLPVNTLSNRVKYALSIYYEYEFKKKHIVKTNYEWVTKLHYTRPDLNIETSEPLDRQATSRVSIGYRHDTQGDNMLIAYRPMLLDILDIHQNKQTSELTVFNPVLILNNEASYLQQLDLISLKSRPIRSRYFKPVSWSFYTGLNRQNPQRDLNYETEFGLGLSNRLSVISLNYTLNLGVDFTSGNYYYKPNATLLARLSDHIKLGINAYEKKYQENKYIERNAFATLSFGQYAISAKYTSQSSTEVEVISLSLHAYFD